jgi:hypothetical protein
MLTACSVAIRLAESIGLHRDGTSAKLPILATEIRRRLFGHFECSTWHVLKTAASFPRTFTAQLLVEFKSSIETKFLRHCQPSDPFQRTALKVGQIILGKQSLISQYPQFHKGRRSSPLSKSLTDVLFATSCEILEHSHEIITDPETTAWTWMLQTYVH